MTRDINVIPYRCPFCGLATEVDPQFAGQSGPCAGCGKMITIPDGWQREGKPPTRNTRWPAGLKLSLTFSAALLSLLLIGALLILLLRPAVHGMQQRAKQARCRQQVERLARAIYAYRDDHGTFPPAYTVDAEQRPLHSWRVLILPYLGAEENAIYGQLRLNEAWDSQHNLRFAQQVPSVYVCSEDLPFAIGDTSYCAVVGARCAFRPERGVPMDEFRDDLETTLLLVELHDSGINWMQPRDIGSRELTLGVNSGVRGGCGSRHSNGVTTIATADGRVHMLSDGTSPDQLLRMATIDGGEFPRPLFAP